MKPNSRITESLGVLGFWLFFATTAVYSNATGLRALTTGGRALAPKTESAELPPRPVPFDSGRCPGLVARYGADADYRCPRGVR